MSAPAVVNPLIRPGRAPRDDMDSTDLFCGAGGSGIGAAAAGVDLYLAANHWQLAIDTHQANFPECRHDRADISQVNPRRYRRTRILWASPECTNHSPAKGKKRITGQGDLFDDGAIDEGAERSRATMWDVPRFAEHHLYDAIIVENVVEAAQWVMFAAWLAAMHALGYEHKIVYLSSMFAPAQKAPRAPQSRDRMYVVFWRRGNRAPDLDIRPPAWCDTCGPVEAVQSWKKPGTPWGRYRSQYVYRCPNVACRNAIVEPYADPAAAAIDWSIAGGRIGDRARPLADKTVARIRAGLRRYGRAMTFEHRGNTFVRFDVETGRARYARAWPVDEPTATLTGTETRALVVPAGGTWRREATTSAEPLPARTSSESDGLLVPLRTNGTAAPTSEPVKTIVAGNVGHALVVPYYGTGVARTSDQPMPTATSRDTVGLVMRNNGDGLSGAWATTPTDEAMRAVTTKGHQSLITVPDQAMPMRNLTARGDQGQMCTPVGEPSRTMTASSVQSIVGWSDAEVDVLVDDCTFRMLEPHEIGAAMGFPGDYRVLGDRRSDVVKQYGNAVTPPAAEVLYRRVVASLEGTCTA